MPMFRKKAPLVHAVQWTGELTPEMELLLGSDVVVKPVAPSTLSIRTYRGDEVAHVGDWAVRIHGIGFDTAGVLAIIAPETFAERYEAADGALPCGHRCDWCDQRASEREAARSAGKTFEQWHDDLIGRPQIGA